MPATCKRKNVDFFIRDKKRWLKKLHLLHTVSKVFRMDLAMSYQAAMVLAGIMLVDTMVLDITQEGIALEDITLGALAPLDTTLGATALVDTTLEAIALEAITLEDTTVGVIVLASIMAVDIMLVDLVADTAVDTHIPLNNNWYEIPLSRFLSFNLCLIFDV